MEDLKRPLKLAFIGGSVDSAVGYTHYIASKMDNLLLLMQVVLAEIIK